METYSEQTGTTNDGIDLTEFYSTTDFNSRTVDNREVRKKQPSQRKVAIAIGTTLGVLLVLATGGVLVYFFSGWFSNSSMVVNADNHTDAANYTNDVVELTMYLLENGEDIDKTCASTSYTNLTIILLNTTDPGNQSVDTIHGLCAITASFVSQNFSSFNFTGGKRKKRDVGTYQDCVNQCQRHLSNPAESLHTTLSEWCPQIPKLPKILCLAADENLFVPNPLVKALLFLIKLFCKLQLCDKITMFAAMGSKLNTDATEEVHMACLNDYCSTTTSTTTPITSSSSTATSVTSTTTLAGVTGAPINTCYWSQGSCDFAYTQFVQYTCIGDEKVFLTFRWCVCCVGTFSCTLILNDGSYSNYGCTANDYKMLCYNYGYLNVTFKIDHVGPNVQRRFNESVSIYSANSSALASIPPR